MTDEAHQFGDLPPEHAANFGPEGPVEAAWAFMRAIFEEGDLQLAWPLIDPALRLRLAEAWIAANREHPLVVSVVPNETAAALAQDPPSSSELWPAFEYTTLGEFDDQYDFTIGGWGVLSQPRAVGLDLEHVVFVPLAELSGTVIEDTIVQTAVVLLLRHGATGWLVTGFQTDQPASAR